MTYPFFMWIAIFVIMTGCSVGPAYRTPSIEVPSSWKEEQDRKCEEVINTQTEFTYLDEWWQVFDDKKLDELESVALANNRTLFVAYERIQEARALVGITKADLYPQINLNPLFTNTCELIKNYVSNTGGAAANAVAGSTIHRAHELLYFFPVNLSYEVDLWGKIRDGYQAAVYNREAQKKDYEAVMLSLTSTLATSYYQLRAADRQLDLFFNVIDTRKKALEINQARYEEEIINYSDVTLAGEELNSVIGQYAEVQRQRELLENQIAVLIGIPSSEFCLEHLPLAGLPPCIPEGIPSEVLIRRPDIAEAEYLVRVDHALVKQAYSQFFPSLTLTAATGFESPVLKDFLKGISRYWMDGAEGNQIVFDGGRTYYNLKLQIARFKEASGTYQQQVLTAFQEVEDSLADLSSYATQYEAAEATTEWAQKSYQLYLDRYELGVTYYIDVVNTERDLLNYQINVNALRGFRYIATIQLIKSLGGGW